MIFNLNIFYFNLVYTYKYVQDTECKRIRTKAGNLCSSSPSDFSYACDFTVKYQIKCPYLFFYHMTSRLGVK